MELLPFQPQAGSGAADNYDSPKIVRDLNASVNQVFHIDFSTRNYGDRFLWTGRHVIFVHYLDRDRVLPSR